jgi:hypothetical protein
MNGPGLPDFSWYHTKHTKTGKIDQITTKYSKCPLIVPNGCKIDQVSIKYTKNFHYKTLQKYPNFDYCLKYTIWQSGNGSFYNIGCRFGT